MRHARSSSSSSRIPESAFLAAQVLFPIVKELREGVISKIITDGTSCSGGGTFPGRNVVNVASARSKVVAHLIFRYTFP